MKKDTENKAIKYKVTYLYEQGSRLVRHIIDYKNKPIIIRIIFYRPKKVQKKVHKAWQNKITKEIIKTKYGI